MTSTELDWLESVRTRVLQKELALAQDTVNQALSEFPGSIDLRRALSGILHQTGDLDQAQRILCSLLEECPGDSASAFALVSILKAQGRMAAAGETLLSCTADGRNRRNADLAITAMDVLVECNRHRDADSIAKSALAANPDDSRLQAYAGMLAVQLGEFERARRHYLSALQREPLAYEWHVPIGLANTRRYSETTHPDFALFKAGLRRENLSDLARAELHFALGKANDDIGNYAEAAQHFAHGNAMRRRTTTWTRKTWRRTIQARLDSRCATETAAPIEGFAPVFIVGMPRTGTTLLAELLSRHALVCNRGELPFLAQLAQQADLSGRPKRFALQRAASRYAMLVRQDDARDARWHLDKQPLNFRYIDLALAMFPGAKIIHCRRSARDTALSIWMQCFLEEVQGYSYDFGDIALVMRDEQRLMTHWRALYPEPIRDVEYEDLVAHPARIVTELASWLGLPVQAGAVLTTPSSSTISTASLWQVRQPVHTKSVGRWQHYAPYLPSLAQIPEG